MTRSAVQHSGLQFMQLHGGYKSYIDIKYKTHASILQFLYTIIAVKKASYSVLYYAQ